MLLVQAFKVVENRINTKFQYIICCWFKILFTLIWHIQIRFNTLYVVGSIINRSRWKRLHLVSIHYMLLVQWNVIQKCILIKSFNTLYVVGSIITFFRFEDLYMFQYIICCWFKFLETNPQYLLSQFQYIICCWFNFSYSQTQKPLIRFQYIICCWFKFLICLVVAV